MNKMDLIAVTDAATGAAIADQGLDLAGARVRALEAYGLALIVADRKKETFFTKLKRKAALRHVVEIQRLLEAVMPLGAVLPAVRGAQLNSETEGLGLLATSHRQLTESLAAFGHKVQFQVIISWQAEEVLRANADMPDIQAARRQATGRMALGREIQKVMERLRVEKAANFAGQLKAVADDTVEEPIDGADMILNMSVLIDPAREVELDAVVETIDVSMPDQLKIKLIGPYPAASFAGVALERFEAEEIEAASSLLGIKPFAEPDQVRAAYIDYVRQCHPDLQSEDDEADANEATDKANRAYKLLKALSPLSAANADAGVSSAVVAQVERSDKMRTAA